MKRFIFYFISLLIFPINANAVSTGMDLYNLCKADEGTASELFLKGRELACITQISGYMDGASVGAYFAYHDMGLSDKEIENKKHILCVPDNATAGQVRLMFNNYAQNHPEELNEDDAVVLGRAIMTGFCKNKE